MIIMKKITYLLTAFFLVALSWQGVAQNGGDDCTLAVEAFDGVPIIGTTITDNNPGGGGGTADDSGWFFYTATGDGTIYVSSCLGGDDTDLFVYDGTCAALNLLDANDDSCDLGTGSNFASEVIDLPVVNGSTYYIEWTDKWGLGPFDWSVTFTPPPSCPDPISLAVTNIVPGTGVDGTATVSWVDAAVGSTFEYEVLNLTLGETATGSGTTTAALFVDLTALVLDNQYQLLVRADCGVNGQSAWASIIWIMSPPPDCVDTPISPLDGATDAAFGVTPLTWTEAVTGTTPTGYQIWFGTTSGSLNLLGTLAAPLSAINITNTLPSTIYYWQAIPENNGDPALGCAEYSFTTKDLPAVPVGVDCSASGDDNFNVITEEFDAQGSWTGTFNGGNGTWIIPQSGATGSGSTGPDSAHSGSNYMFYEASGSTVARASAVTAVDLTGSTGGAELSFFMYAYGAGMGTLEVGVSTAGAAGPFVNLFTWSGGIQPDGAQAWTPVGVNLDAYINQAIHIEVAHTGTSDFTGDMAIDLFNVETCLTFLCDAPANLAITNIDGVDVDIAWDASPTETNGYAWEIQPQGNAQGDAGEINSGTTLTGVTSVLDVAGPFALGSYTLFVSTDCGIGGTSTYSSQVFDVTLGANCGAFTSSPGIFFDETAPAVDVITGSGSGSDVINDLDVYLDVTHTWVGDMTITLLSPTGTSVTILDGNCGNVDNLDVLFDDAGAPVVCASPTTGIYVPLGSLGDFNGETFDGNWTLTISDSASGDDGTLNTWCLIPTLGAAPTCFQPVNLAITDITTTDVDLSWDEAPSATDGYRWEIQPFGAAQGDGTVIDSGYNSAGSTDTTVTDASGPFAPGGVYNLFVNSVCVDGVDESVYSSQTFFIPVGVACGMYTSSPALFFDENAPAVDVINTGAGTGEVLGDLDVYLDISHTWLSDMTINLTSPSGTSIVLLAGVCGSNDDLDILLDDSGAAINCGSPTTGIVIPDNALATFNGETFDGNWTLTITDGAAGDDGTLNTWCLVPTLVPNPDCAGATRTWNGATWLGGIGPVLDTQTAVLDVSDYDTGASGNIDACQIIIGLGRTLTVPDGSFASAVNDIVNNGTLNVATDGSVIQESGTAVTVNNGAIAVTKTTAALNAGDFSIIGSPMSGESKATLFAGPMLVMNHTTNNFLPHPDVTVLEGAADNWADDNGDDWNLHTGNWNPGEGYLVRPIGGGAIDVTHTVGTLNSGDITYFADFVTDQNGSPNILSNPYASGLNISAFLSLPANAAVGGAVYFWEHRIAPGTGGYPGFYPANYSMQDISMHNGTTGTGSGSGSAAPGDDIPSGQGFGIKVTVAGDVTFTNAMRNGNNSGYRNSETIDELHLTVSNEVYGLKGRMAVAFTDFSTNGIERSDIKRLATPISLYSEVEDMELGIQMRSVFTEDQIVPLGFHTNVDENQTYTISIGNVEGELISNATVFLKDNLLNSLTNLSETDYTFTANVGFQSNRFVLVFETTVLGNQELSLEAVSLYPIPTVSMLNINSPLAKVNTVVIFDISGRQVAFYNFTDQNSYQMDVTSLESAVYFVEINTDDGSVTKRIVKE